MLKIKDTSIHIQNGNQLDNKQIIIKCGNTDLNILELDSVYEVQTIRMEQRPAT